MRPAGHDWRDTAFPLTLPGFKPTRTGSGPNFQRLGTFLHALLKKRRGETTLVGAAGTNTLRVGIGAHETQCSSDLNPPVLLSASAM